MRGRWRQLWAQKGADHSDANAMSGGGVMPRRSCLSIANRGIMVPDSLWRLLR